MAEKTNEQLLKTVSIAAAKKGTMPILENFCFYNGRVQCFDSTVAIDAPFESGLDLTVPVKQFMATTSGAGKVSYSVNKKLTIKTDKLKASFSFMPIDQYPIVKEATTKKKLKTPFIEVLKVLYGFIDTNANRAWSTGILIDDGYAYATDNIVIARDVVPKMPRIVLPARTIDVLVKIGQEPTHYHVADGSIYLWFMDGMWLRSALLEDTWPDAKKIIDGSERNNVFGISDINDDLATLTKFDTSKDHSIVSFDGSNMNLSDASSDVAIPCDMDESYFNLSALRKVSQTASILHVNWPSPCYFENGTFDGVIVGVKHEG